MPDFDYRGLGMADWLDVVNGYAIPEPSRPFATRGMTFKQIVTRVSAEIGLAGGGPRYMRDFAGNTLKASARFAEKLAKYANHAAYAGWIETTVQRPLEVWEHPDPRSGDMRPRRHYMAAYVGPSGATTHLIVAAFGSVLLTGFRVENVSTANNDRFGSLLYIGYDPVYPPLPKGKGAPFPMAPLPV